MTVEGHVGTLAVRYERLVLALGSVARTVPVQASRSMRSASTTSPTRSLRNHVLRELEAADAELDPERAAPPPRLRLRRRGYAGVEALAELRTLVRDALRHYPRLPAVPQRWVLVEAGDRILHELPERLGTYVVRLLERQGAEVRTRTRLELLDADSATLSDGERIETHTLVWTAGVRLNPLLAEWGLPDRPGRGGRAAARDRTRRRLGARDGARVPNGDRQRLTRPRASMRSGRRAGWRRTSAATSSHAYRMIGMGATLGRFKGVAEVFGIRLRGFPGWFATRSYHLLQLPLHRKAARRDRLDRGDALPSRHRRARLAATAACTEQVHLVSGATQRVREALLRRRHALEQVTVLPDSAAHGLHREARRVEVLVDLFPAQRRRDRRAGVAAQVHRRDRLPPHRSGSSRSGRRAASTSSTPSSRPRFERAIAPATISANAACRRRCGDARSGRGRACRPRSTSSRSRRDRTRRAPL